MSRKGCCFLLANGGDDRLEFSEKRLQKVEEIFQEQLLKSYFFKKKLINLMFKNLTHQIFSNQNFVIENRHFRKYKKQRLL